MTQQEFNTQLLQKAKPKGWFLTFLLNKVLPFLWENRDEIGDLFRKDKLPNPKNTSATLCGGLEKPTYNQSPNGYWSCVGSTWTWIEDIGIGG